MILCLILLACCIIALAVGFCLGAMSERTMQEQTAQLDLESMDATIRTGLALLVLFIILFIVRLYFLTGTTPLTINL